VVNRFVVLVLWLGTTLISITSHQEQSCTLTAGGRVTIDRRQPQG